MKTDQDLIFEAYTTTLNESDESRAKNIHEGSFWGQDEMVAQMRADEKKRGMVRLKKIDDGRYHGKTVHKSKVQALLDDGWEYADKKPTEEDNESNVSKYYKQAYDFAKENPGVSSFQVNPYEEFSDEYIQFEDGFEDGLAQSGAGWSSEAGNYASEGAVNLLEQLKEEVPELEDKINQILEKVFDAVDILKQEPYVDDPQLVKAHDSLIEGDY